jgi:hypothetical protein
VKKWLGRAAYWIRHDIEGLWLPIHAHGEGLWHLLRGHRTRWFQDPDPWNGLFGFLICYECSSTDPGAEGYPNDLAIWSHYWPALDCLMERLCPLLGGHRGHKRAIITRNFGEPNEEEAETDQWYCGRCLADTPAPVEPGR